MLRRVIVPQTRLLCWFALIALPFAALGSLLPEVAAPAFALIAGFLMLALVDAGLALGRLDGLSLELPEVLRLSKDRPGTLEVIVRNAGRKARRVRLGLALPPELRAEEEEVQVLLPAEAEHARLDWPCTPVRRGNYRLRRAYLETSSRLGFWAVRGSVPVQCEVRVYPNLLAERRNLAALFLNRGAYGVHARRQVGKGRDFEKLREYIPGDGYDEIHWKATAKRGHPVTKVFQIERTQEVYVIIDASRLSARRMPRGQSSVPTDTATSNPLGVTPEAPLADSTTLERFITAALILAQAAQKQGDLFGLLTFTDQADLFLRAKNGRQHYAACRDALYTLEPRNITPDFDEICAFIRTRLRRRALLLFLTSLDDPVLAESFVHNMSLLAGQHLVLVNMIQPPGADPLFTHGNVTDLDDVYRELGGHMQWHRLRELEKVLQRRGVHFRRIEQEQLAGDLVTQYLGVKQRQLL